MNMNTGATYLHDMLVLSTTDQGTAGVELQQTRGDMECKLALVVFRRGECFQLPLNEAQLVLHDLLGCGLHLSLDN
jgi:hypothetical protein